jgi:hypothetical protein
VTHFCATQSLEEKYVVFKLSVQIQFQSNRGVFMMISKNKITFDYILNQIISEHFFEYTKILLIFEQHFHFEPNQYFLVH